MKAIEIIKSSINVIGSTIGVILIAIGAVMLVGSTLKLTVFGLTADPYYSVYGCDMYIESHMDGKDFDGRESQASALTLAEKEAAYEKCMIREREREQERFVNGKKHTIIDGIALLIVGIPIFIYYMRRSRRN